MSFADIALDPRLQRALSKLNYTKPTLVQQTAIPLALQGKDLLARARTGSGKTNAYLLPAIQKILSNPEPAIRALILVPTRELAQQVTQNIAELTRFCSKEVRAVNISVSDHHTTQIPLLKNLPSIIVSTPSRICHHLEEGNVILQDLQTLVIDEADLILSYGYDEEIDKIIKHLPKIHQSFLMSATLSPDVEKLKSLILRNPAILKLEESEEEQLLSQYYVRCPEEEKFLLMYFMLKLKIHPFGSKKSIIFVNSIERCYKLKLFLEQFGIKSCALNSELPLKSRIHIVQEFNRGVYDFIIATDENNVETKFTEIDSDDDQNTLVKEVSDIDQTQLLKDEKNQISVELKKTKSKKNRQIKKDNEYGVSRGIDFRNVAAVINFDMPCTAKAYQHRVGRTARGVGNKGYALSFVCPDNEGVNANKKGYKVTDEEILERIIRKQSATGKTLSPFIFDMSPVEGFRYRCTDALRAVTGVSVKEARLKDVRNELINSEKLKAHFEDNPADLDALRHDITLHPARIQTHMKHIPDYLIPKKKINVSAGSAVGYVPFNIQKKSKKNKYRKSVGVSKKRKADPLKSFSILKK